LKSLAHPNWPYVGTPHEWRGFGPVFLPPSLYDEAERQGYDMHGYVKQQPVPYQKLNFGPELT
jgi:hypothetical protein